MGNDPATNQPWSERQHKPEYAPPGNHGPFNYPFKYGYEENSGCPVDQRLSWRLRQTLGLMFKALTVAGLRGHNLDALDGQALRKWQTMMETHLKKLEMAGKKADEEAE